MRAKSGRSLRLDSRIDRVRSVMAAQIAEYTGAMSAQHQQSRLCLWPWLCLRIWLQAEGVCGFSLTFCAVLQEVMESFGVTLQRGKRPLVSHVMKMTR